MFVNQKKTKQKLMTNVKLLAQSIGNKQIVNFCNMRIM